MNSNANIYISQATRLPSLSTITSSGAITVSATAVAGTGASLTLRRVSVRCGSRHVPQSMRAQIAALSRVAAARAICTQAITTKSRDDGIVSSSLGPSLKGYTVLQHGIRGILFRDT